MYKHDLKVAGEYLAKGLALPQNTSLTTPQTPLRLSGTLGGVEVKAVVVEEVVLAESTTLSITLVHADEAAGAYTELAVLAEITGEAGGTTLPAGTLLARLTLPETVKEYVKSTLATTDPAATGSVSIYPVYLAR